MPHRRTTVVPFALGLFCGALTLSACSSDADAPRSVEVVPSNEPATEEEPARAPEMTFIATYPATLLYALDGAAGLRNHDPGYRAWLVGNDEEAPWLDDYAARRDGWTRSRVADHGGGAGAFDVCGWTTRTVPELTTCLEDVVLPFDHAVLKRALDEADRRLAPKWPAIEARLGELASAMAKSLETEPAKRLFATLRHEASLDERAPLRFEVVLVGKPPGDHTFAHQVGAHLVHEVGDTSTSGDLLGVAFHEIAHLAHFMSPERAAFERAFLQRGDDGWLAANLWDEVVATAFGNGLAAEAFDPAFRVERSFYADVAIDTLGRALYQEWTSGRDVRLDRDLAEHLTQLAGTKLGPEARSAGRHLWYLSVTAESSSTLATVLDGYTGRGLYRDRPIDETMAAPKGLPPWGARVVLATAAEMSAHPALVTRTSMPEGSWNTALEGHAAAVFRRTDEDGAPLLVVVAPDDAGLKKAFPALLRRPQMVPEGWTAW